MKRNKIDFQNLLKVFHEYINILYNNKKNFIKN